jgi:hypothetical protein
MVAQQQVGAPPQPLLLVALPPWPVLPMHLLPPLHAAPLLLVLLLLRRALRRVLLQTLLRPCPPRPPRLTGPGGPHQTG